MKILKSSQIRDVDSYTIQNEPIKSIDLMERAAYSITNWIISNIDKKDEINIFAGPGNNGGDGLAIARQLFEKDYKVNVFLVKISDKLSEDCQINLERLKKYNQIEVREILSDSDFPDLNNEDIIIDALFGSGLTRKLEGLPANLVKYINESGCRVIAVDIPSGLFGEDNDVNDLDSVIKANFTLSFQLPKLAFMFACNFSNVGEWRILPIGLNEDFIAQQKTDFNFITKDDVKSKILKRLKFSHKGTYGHVLMVSGSYGKMGAAILACKAALRTGSGLVTAHIPKVGYEIMQTALPEAMISIDWSDIIISNVPGIENYTNIGIGPGIGTKMNTRKALQNLIENSKSPLLIDADAINILSENKELLEKIPNNSILTPHPKEFERIAGKVDGDYKRIQLLKEMAVKYNFYIVLKGAHTAVACPNGEVYFNSTGNPGMATAGSGDVLSGMILSLLGQGYDSKNAAIIGVYLHGLAADLATEAKGQESLIASDIIDYIGNAFLKIRNDEIN